MQAAGKKPGEVVNIGFDTSPQIVEAFKDGERGRASRGRRRRLEQDRQVGKHADTHDAQPRHGRVAPRGLGVREVRNQPIEVAYASASAALRFLPKIHASTMLSM